MVWCILESEFPKEEYNKDVLAGWGTGGGRGGGPSVEPVLAP